MLLYAARAARFERPGTGGTNRAARPQSHPLRAQLPCARSALVTASRSIEKAVPEEHRGPTANCSSWRVTKVGTNQRRSGLPRLRFAVYLRLIPIRVARLMHHRTHSFPMPGLSDCVETPAPLSRLILPASALERGAA